MFANSKGEWKNVVKRIYGRKIFNNYEKSVDVFKTLGYDSFYKNATVLDCYPGAAVFSAALYNTIKPQNHVFMEPFKQFNAYLSQQKGLNTHVTPLDPYRWDSFNVLESEGAYKIESQPFNQIHNQTLFVANLTHAQGEQLCAQYLNCIGNRSWIMKHGRIRLLLWLRAATAEKLVAGAGEKTRNRISVQRESCCDAKIIFHDQGAIAKGPTRRDAPYPSMLRNPLLPFDSKVDLETSRTDSYITLVELTPKERPVQHIDSFEYVIKMLFHVRSTPLKEALNYLGHGAVDDLSPKLTDILHKLPSELTLEEVERVTQAFWEWPFKPTVLHEFYEESMLGNGNATEL